jgi:hypothetical protein
MHYKWNKSESFPTDNFRKYCLYDTKYTRNKSKQHVCEAPERNSGDVPESSAETFNKKFNKTESVLQNQLVAKEFLAVIQSVFRQTEIKPSEVQRRKILNF